MKSEFKGTVSVISSGIPCRDANARFTLYLIKYVEDIKNAQRKKMKKHSLKKQKFYI